LNSHQIAHEYREYTEEPLSIEEIESILVLLGVGPRHVLRTNDKVYRELGLSGGESDAELVGLMARFPMLLQRPIGVLGDRATIGRPPERLLDLLEPRLATP
jgi:arsenate reductase